MLYPQIWSFVTKGQGGQGGQLAALEGKRQKACMQKEQSKIQNLLSKIQWTRGARGTREKKAGFSLVCSFSPIFPLFPIFPISQGVQDLWVRNRPKRKALIRESLEKNTA